MDVFRDSTKCIKTAPSHLGSPVFIEWLSMGGDKSNLYSFHLIVFLPALSPVCPAC